MLMAVLVDWCWFLLFRCFSFRLVVWRRGLGLIIGSGMEARRSIWSLDKWRLAIGKWDGMVYLLIEKSGLRSGELEWKGQALYATLGWVGCFGLFLRTY